MEITKENELKIFNTIAEFFCDYGDEIDIEYYEDDYYCGEINDVIKSYLRRTRDENRFIGIEGILVVVAAGFGWKILESEITHVFDSPGLDIYIWSFVLMNDETGEVKCYLNNQYDRC